MILAITQKLTDPSNYGPVYKAPPELVILHGSGLPAGATGEAEVAYLQRPNLHVSYHYYIAKTGTIYRLVPKGHVAWHAGVSEWSEAAAETRGVTFPAEDAGRSWAGLNAYSIGIGLESHNAPNEIYPTEQAKACLELCRMLCAQWGIASHRVLTHRHISAPRKIDPVGWRHDVFQTFLEDAA